MKQAKSDILQGTLDLLILRTLASGEMHGWGVSQRLQQISQDVLQVTQGSLYPALYGLASDPSDELYQPFARTGTLSATLLVRTAGEPTAYADRIPAIVREIDPRQPVSRIQTLEAIRSRSLAPPRLTAMLVALFAVVALVVTAAGIAGVASFSVNRRTAEIGVRMALGAPRASVTALIVRQGLTPVTIGLCLGLVSALLITPVVTHLLFAVGPADPLTYAAVAAVMTMVAALACLAPARRAAAIDPITALRAD